MEMRYRQLGDSGLTVSVVGLGCNNFRSRTSDDDARAVIDAAIERGVTLFDTADIYGGGGGSEELIGEALGSRREQVVLATKFGMAMPDAGPEARGSRRYIRKAVRDSLRRLRTEDRKSTRLNSSHANISYAVFCLKKKKLIDAMIH